MLAVLAGVTLLAACGREAPTPAGSAPPTAAAAPVPTASTVERPPDADGFVTLFDGTSLDGWTGDRAGWSIESGALTCGPEGRDIYAPGEWGDFELTLEFRVSPGANNGIAVRAPGAGDAAYEGMEIQVLDDGHAKYEGWLKDWQRHGSVYGIAASRGSTAALRPAGEWNQQSMELNGRKVNVRLNDTVILDVDLDQAMAAGTLSGHAHPGAGRASGRIGFLGHGDRVQYRNVRVRPLDSTPR
ncbi:MAG: hypothetical protein RI990_751 [Planctomycetota bacterium]